MPVPDATASVKIVEAPDPAFVVLSMALKLSEELTMTGSSAAPDVIINLSLPSKL